MSEQMTPTQRVEALRHKVASANFEINNQCMSLLGDVIRDSESLATELEAVQELNTKTEKCDTCGKLENPSLVESGTCIFCIAKSISLRCDERTEQRDAAIAELTHLRATNLILQSQIVAMREALQSAKYFILHASDECAKKSLAHPERCDCGASEAQEKVMQSLSPTSHLPVMERLKAADKMHDALTLICLNFARSDASGNFLGDDEHESWTAAVNARSGYAPSESQPSTSEGNKV